MYPVQAVFKGDDMVYKKIQEFGKRKNLFTKKSHTEKQIHLAIDKNSLQDAGFFMPITMAVQYALNEMGFDGDFTIRKLNGGVEIILEK
jgi:hypothetical protein